MEGAASIGSYGKRAIAALTAGCDMVLVCNQRQGVLDVIKSLSTDEVSIYFEANNHRLMTIKPRQQWSAASELNNKERAQEIRAVLNAIVK